MTIERSECSRCKGTGQDPETLNSVCKKCSGMKDLDWIENITGFELTRSQKTLLYVINILNDLAEMGILSKGPFVIDERSKGLIKDFKPTEDEMEHAIIELKIGGYVG